MKLDFSTYLEEAQISDENFDRLVSAFQRRMPRLLGTEIYRYGGHRGIENLPGGDTGVLFIFGDRAFRIRAKGGHVKAIDIWDKFTTARGPSFIADVHNLAGESILGAFKQIADIIKNPTAGKIKVGAVSESIQLDEMASRVGPQEFYNMMVKEYGKAGARSVTWDQIKAVATKNDVLIPAYIRGQKVGRGMWNAEPGTTTDVGDAPARSAGGDEEPEMTPGTELVPVAGGKGKGPIMYIKVTAQDPETKRFISGANNKEVQQLYKQLQSALEGPPPEEEVRDPETLYGHMAQLVEMACKGNLRSLLIYGGPGTGKTYTIMQTVNNMGLVKGKDYQKLSGKASPIKIYETLFMYRDGGMVIFDDLDSMWGNEDATNILKAALDTSPVREISWVSNQTINVSKMSDERKQELFASIDRAINGEVEPVSDVDDDDEDDEDLTPRERRAKQKAREKAAAGTAPDKIKFPSSFDFTGRVVFISNLKKEEFDTAILSRSAKINMDLTPAEILQRMKNILPGLGGSDVSLEVKQELLDELVAQHAKGIFDAVTMREFIKGLDIVRSGAPNWKELLQYS